MLENYSVGSTEKRLDTYNTITWLESLTINRPRPICGGTRAPVGKQEHSCTILVHITTL